MDNETMIEFGFYYWIRFLAVPKPKAEAVNTYLALDNSGYHEKPHRVIAYNAFDM